MQTITTKVALKQALAHARHDNKSVGFVPTMGSLHQGHAALMRAGRAGNDVLVASIYVNPTQFGTDEDLHAYPSNPEGDAALCKACGVDILWVPDKDQVYRSDHSTTVSVRGLSEGLCGRSRPVHFEGVATITAKLFNLIRPTRTYFGQKDMQQLAVVRRMARDLEIGVDVVGVPTVREPDGLAMSSRNTYLEPDERQAALVLSQALHKARVAYGAGTRSVDELTDLIYATIEHERLTHIDYVEIVHPDTLVPLLGVIDEDVGASIAVAVQIGRARLIDNARIDQPDSNGLPTVTA